MDQVETKALLKSGYKKEIEKILMEYPVLKQSITDERYHFPSCTTVYEERIGHTYSEYQSDTEKFGIQKADKYLQVQRIEQALTVLSDKERELIVTRYFDPNQPSDYAVSIQLDWSRSDYYRVKKRAFCKLAIVLNLI